MKIPIRPAQKRITYACQDPSRGEIIATFFATARPIVRLERGGTSLLAAQVRSASGAKYLAKGGVTFWIKGEDAMVQWPQGNQFNCRVKPAGR